MTEVEFTILCTRVGLYAVHTQGIYYAVSPVYVLYHAFQSLADNQDMIRPGAHARFQIEEAMLPFLSLDYQQDHLMNQMLRLTDPYPLPRIHSLTALPPRYDGIHNDEGIATGVRYYYNHARRCIQEYRECGLRSHVLLRIEVPGSHPFSYQLIQMAPIDNLVPVHYYTRYERSVILPLEIVLVYEYPRYTQKGDFVQNDGGRVTSTEVRAQLQRKRRESGDIIEH